MNSFCIGKIGNFLDYFTDSDLLVALAGFF